MKELKKEILQALIYTWVLSGSGKNDELQPVIYSLNRFFKGDFDPVIKFNNRDFSFPELKEDFLFALTTLITETYSDDNSFVQTSFADRCKYCAYNTICQRF